MNATGERLDADELLHLALNAAEANRHEEAITSLKRALDLSPQDARLHYLLGAEHAQIGLHDRAIEEIGRAVALDPGLIMARFQLGLLHLTSGRVEQAERIWAPLEALDPGNALRQFKTGLLHLARDEFTDCARCLQEGMAANLEHPTLNKDMQRVLSTIEERGEAGAGASPIANAQQGADPAKPKSARLLTAYRNRVEDRE